MFPFLSSSDLQIFRCVSVSLLLEVTRFKAKLWSYKVSSAKEKKEKKEGIVFVYEISKNPLKVADDFPKPVGPLPQNNLSAIFNTLVPMKSIGIELNIIHQSPSLLFCNNPQSPRFVSTSNVTSFPVSITWIIRLQPHLHAPANLALLKWTNYFNFDFLIKSIRDVVSYEVILQVLWGLCRASWPY